MFVSEETASTKALTGAVRDVRQLVVDYRKSNSSLTTDVSWRLSASSEFLQLQLLLTWDVHAFLQSVVVAESPNLISAIFVDFDIFQSNNSIMCPAYYDKML